MLESLGSYLYALRRHGANGSEVVLRRMKHTPKLPMAMVFSEASENNIHGYGIYWAPGQKRVLESPSGQKRHRGFGPARPGTRCVTPGTPVGAPGFQPQTAVDHRGLRPKLRSITAIYNRKPRSADRNFDRSPKNDWLRCRRVVGLTLPPALLAFVMSEALGSRPAPGTPCGKRSVGTRRAASMQDTLFEGQPHAQRSWHLQRSPPAQSEDLPPGVWLAESLRRRAARRGARAIARRCRWTPAPGVQLYLPCGKGAAPQRPPSAWTAIRA